MKMTLRRSGSQKSKEPGCHHVLPLRVSKFTLETILPCTPSQGRGVQALFESEFLKAQCGASGPDSLGETGKTLV